MATATPKATYRTATKCLNCGFGPVVASLEAGTPVSAYECAACLCKTLVAVPDTLRTIGLPAE